MSESSAEFSSFLVLHATIGQTGRKVLVPGPQKSVVEVDIRSFFSIVEVFLVTEDLQKVSKNTISSGNGNTSCCFDLVSVGAGWSRRLPSWTNPPHPPTKQNKTDGSCDFFWEGLSCLDQEKTACFL